MERINDHPLLYVEWKHFLICELKKNCKLFVEIPMLDTRTNLDTTMSKGVRNISRQDLLYMIKETFDEINEQYMVTFRSIGDGERKYFIVVSIINQSPNKKCN